jgi:hypothetical protein
LLVEGEGFEPSYSERADLQSAAFNHSATPPAKPQIISTIQGPVNACFALQHSRSAGGVESVASAQQLVMIGLFHSSRTALAIDSRPPRLCVLKAIKRVLDPDNLLNPGEILPD